MRVSRVLHASSDTVVVFRQSMKVPRLARIDALRGRSGGGRRFRTGRLLGAGKLEC